MAIFVARTTTEEDRNRHHGVSDLFIQLSRFVQLHLLFVGVFKRFQSQSTSQAELGTLCVSTRFQSCRTFENPTMVIFVARKTI
jgi:hypothetical protein